MRESQEGERVVGERHGDGGNRAGRDDEHQRPAVQKCRQRTECLAQVDIPAAGAGPPLAQLAPAKRADQCDDSADHPGQQY